MLTKSELIELIQDYLSRRGDIRKFIGWFSDDLPFAVSGPMRNLIDFVNALDHEELNQHEKNNLKNIIDSDTAGENVNLTTEVFNQIRLKFSIEEMVENFPPLAVAPINFDLASFKLDLKLLPEINQPIDLTQLVASIQPPDILPYLHQLPKPTVLQHMANNYNFAMPDFDANIRNWDIRRNPPPNNEQPMEATDSDVEDVTYNDNYDNGFLMWHPSNHPNIEKFFKADSRNDLIKNSRILFQSYKNGTGFFAMLPEELLFEIAALTGNPHEDNHKIACNNFNRPKV